MLLSGEKEMCVRSSLNVLPNNPFLWALIIKYDHLLSAPEFYQENYKPAEKSLIGPPKEIFRDVLTGIWTGVDVLQRPGN